MKPPVLGSQENHLLNSQLLVFTVLESTVGTVTTLWIGQWGGGLNFGKGKKFFSSLKYQKQPWGPTQPPSQWVPKALSPQVKWLGHEGDHILQSSAQVKSKWNCYSTPHICLHATYRDICTCFLFTLILKAAIS